MVVDAGLQASASTAASASSEMRKMSGRPGIAVVVNAATGVPHSTLGGCNANGTVPRASVAAAIGHRVASEKATRLTTLRRPTRHRLHASEVDNTITAVARISCVMRTSRPTMLRNHCQDMRAASQMTTQHSGNNTMHQPASQARSGCKPASAAPRATAQPAIARPTAGTTPSHHNRARSRSTSMVLATKSMPSKIGITASGSHSRVVVTTAAANMARQVVGKPPGGPTRSVIPPNAR